MGYGTKQCGCEKTGTRLGGDTLALNVKMEEGHDGSECENGGGTRAVNLFYRRNYACYVEQ